MNAPMTTLTLPQPATLGSPYNHQGHGGGGDCRGCASQLPLTLADRERLHSRSFRQHDQSRDWHDEFCTECLAGLPHGLAALFHVCEVTPMAETITATPAAPLAARDLTAALRRQFKDIRLATAGTGVAGEFEVTIPEGSFRMAGGAWGIAGILTRELDVVFGVDGTRWRRRWGTQVAIASLHTRRSDARP
jgi:hypothetical protein